METPANGCCSGGTGTVRREAQRQLASLVAVGWNSDNKATEDVARAQHEVAFHKAKNDLNLAKIFELVHSCDVCNNALPEVDKAHPTCPVALSTRLLQSQEERMHKIQTIAKKIAATDSLIKVLESRLKTFGKTEKSPKVVTMGPGMECRYEITADDGVSLVIHHSNGGQHESIARSQPNIMDTDIFPPILTPILVPIYIQSDTALS
ncbi:hypothetical protein F4678DRAFT_451774 [Xylaria arbuscula]|nr:hypothetical protein F4678DRAFT_451774 [Xylaria arbuscula]